MRYFYGIVAATGIFLLVVLGVTSKGDIASLWRYLNDSGAYPGSSFVTLNKVFTGDTGALDIVTDERSQDYRREFPNFDDDIAGILVNDTSADETAAYRAFLDDMEKLKSEAPSLGATETARRAMLAIREKFVAKQGSPRKVTDGAIGGKKARPEGFVYYLVNAETACGTVSEATVAIFRQLGFKARQIIVSHQLSPMIASHVVAEYFDPDLSKWIMLDPMVGFIGTDADRPVSVFQAINSPAVSEFLNAAHGGPVPFYGDNSVAWYDRWGPVRQKVYYTRLEKNRDVVESQIKD